MKKTVKLSENPAILKVKGNRFLSNNGNIIMAYALSLPEVFTLSENDYEMMHDYWFRTLRLLPQYSYVHKQDIFLKEKYMAEDLPYRTFLQKATADHFKGRENLLHIPLLFIGNRGSSFLKNSSIRNPFASLPNAQKVAQEIERDSYFVSEVEKTIDFLNQSPYFKAVPLSEDDIWNLQDSYFNGFEKGNYTDTHLEEKAGNINTILVGDKYVGAYSIHSIQQFPEYIDVTKADGVYSSKKFIFYKGLADDFGFRIPFTHVYNQMVYIDNHLQKKEQIKENTRRFQGAKGFDPENEEIGEELKSYVRELSKDEQKVLVQGHTNVIFYAPNEKLFFEYATKVENIFKTHNFRPKYPKKEILKEIYLNSFPAFSGDMSKARMYDTELKISTALFLNVTTYRSDEQGIPFSDRIFNIPIKRDVRDENKKRIKAWNYTIYAPTGEGKSVLAQHLIRHFNEFGYKNVVFDIGGSFKKLALLLPQEKTLFFSYEVGKPIPLNPFAVENSNEISVTKFRSLAQFVFKLWRPEDTISSDIETALLKILKEYYRNVNKHNFPYFYRFIYENKEKLLAYLGIETRFFDVDNFLFSCSRYVGDGAYSFLFQEVEDFSGLIDEKDFIVFEFDKAQEDPVALSILLGLGAEAIKKLVWEDRTVPSSIFIDEMAKFIKVKSIRDDVVFFYQAIRKQNACIGTALQSPAQLPEAEDTEAMIDNTQVLYVLYNEKGYQPLVRRFRLSEHQHTILKSLTSINDGKKSYVEFALIIGKEIWVHRLELPKEALKTYLTDGEEFEQIMSLYNEIGDMEVAIKEHIRRGY
ncbi:DUF3875 domain-containing protein [Capnocytophaga canimorsus]|uniref:TraG/VirB4 family ATPase n=1 Tax=Capnocytophaga canimorsus TaxID=28188 RepID=UPI0037D380DF